MLVIAVEILLKRDHLTPDGLHPGHGQLRVRLAERWVSTGDHCCFQRSAGQKSLERHERVIDVLAISSLSAARLPFSALAGTVAAYPDTPDNWRAR